MSNKPFDFNDFEMSGSSGLDAELTFEPKKARRRVIRKVGSLGDLSSFIRVSGEELVHRSSRDLWALKKEADGSFFIERLFDDNGSPLKG